jgi:hypothetical protein
MKKLFFLIAVMFISLNAFAQSTIYVNGYTKSNGTYVEPHYRTSPNKTVIDNYSTKGNYNPYTGNIGTKAIIEYRSTPTYSNSYYTPVYMPSSSSYSSYTPVYTGPRGGTYYYNSNGNKTYIRN